MADGTSTPQQRLYTAIIIAVVTVVVAVSGFLVTRSSVGTWYATLRRSRLSPPNRAFGIVWTTLYVTIAIGTYLAYAAATTDAQRSAVMGVFIAQMGANLLWTVLFFGMRRPAAALVGIFLLLGLIVLSIQVYASVSAVAAWLLVPYLLWVSYASLLNADVIRLNPEDAFGPGTRCEGRHIRDGWR
jgi:benzodiazapine receptor